MNKYTLLGKHLRQQNPLILSKVSQLYHSYTIVIPYNHLPHNEYENAYQNSMYYSTKFIVSVPDTYKGKEGIANNKFPKAEEWDAEQVNVRIDLIKKYVKYFTLGHLEKAI